RLVTAPASDRADVAPTVQVARGAEIRRNRAPLRAHREDRAAQNEGRRSRRQGRDLGSHATSILPDDDRGGAATGRLKGRLRGEKLRSIDGRAPCMSPL